MQQFRELNVNVSPVEPDAEEVFEIMECNWPSFSAFLACASQWRVVPAVSGSMAGIATTLVFLGLDHTAVDVTLRRLDAPAHVFEDILAMADAALPVLNEVDA
ncbi:uncharacterized protein DUF1799 [Rhizobium subbaraonis]|uniref:Uncharacterized protein DUF1799 n=1 Tax=Rhizobium subbaraonis TaxID=908946 RepID=A0A285UXW9_9HYPH|nr:DUF1799 domain-containing protein [Rhizobium subbaraonis]SOC46670.1 uncharacterized protein DUF1799 [Rhizobium subbaraonis]